jgi:hypothetical protein
MEEAVELAELVGGELWPVVVEEFPPDTWHVKQLEADGREDKRPVLTHHIAGNADPEHIVLHAV